MHEEVLLNGSRLVAVVFIYCAVAVAWFILGGSVVHRTGESDDKLAQEVAQLWGGRHTQIAPDAWIERPRQVVEQTQVTDEKGQAVTREVTRTVFDKVPVGLQQSRLKVDLALDQRRKGLLWYDTYGVAFSGNYELQNPDPEPRTLSVHLPFPSTQAIYDGFVFRVNGQEVPPGQDLAQGITANVRLDAAARAVVEVAYRSRGLGEWTYAFAPSGVAQVRDFSLDMRTDFTAVDFPSGTLSPTTRGEHPGGADVHWRFDRLITGQRLGMDPPDRINPGPLAARITFFAPVGLLFFITVMVILGVLRGRSLHPMNYFFLAAAFFAFHLLLAYLVDHVNIHASFLIAAATSIFLVVSYLRLVGGLRFAVLEAGLAQLVFLVLFSYAFFFEGYTGLTVTVGSVITLFVLMQVTGRVDWGHVLGGPLPGKEQTERA
ncbi:MAG: inner membrane CreD family protein [bacterium]